MKKINEFIKKCFDFNDTLDGYMCKMKEGNCKYIIKGRVFHTNNAKKHLLSKHSSEYNIKSQEYLVESVTNQPRTTLLSFLSSNTINTPKIIKTVCSKDSFINNIISLFTVNGRPFSLIDDSGFQFLIKPYIQAFQLKINRKNVQNFIKEETIRQKNILKNLLADKILCIKYDTSTRHRKQFLSVNCQFVSFGRISILHLGMRELTTVATGKNLAGLLLSILDEFDITIEQVFAVTVDNGKKARTRVV